MGDIMGQLGQLGSSVMQGVGDVGGELATGAQDLFGGIGQGLTGLENAFGLSGGGGAVSPGTLGGTASTIANAAPAAAGAATDASAIAPGGMSAASFGVGPGAEAGLDSGMTGIPLPTSTALGGATLNPTAINAAGMGGDLGAGISPSFKPTNFLDQLLGNKKALGAGATGLSTLIGQMNQPSLGGLKKLEGEQAGFAKSQGEVAQAEQQGLLPAGANQMFQGVLNAQLAAIRSKYAEMGMTGSTSEMQDLNAARESVMQQIFAVGQNMAQTGYTNMQNATGIENDLLQQIYNAQVAHSEGLGKSLANFAAAFTDMSGGGG